MEGNVYKKYFSFLSRKPYFGKGCTLNTTKNKTISGKIELPFRLDVENRPHQIYDEIFGKWGTTNFQLLMKSETAEILHHFNLSKKQLESFEKQNVFIPISFEPKTGRTHQLRLHSSSIHGLNAPIIGDNLYGTQNENERLMLHAAELSFNHPKTKERIFFKT